jgi:hypothetical protein
MSIVKHKPCANPPCSRPAVNKYCSKKCSAAVRNRRYYRTFKGRQNKQAAASRYFQRHKQQLYEKRAIRMQQYAGDLIHNEIRRELSLYRPKDSFVIGRIEQKATQTSKRLNRFLHDYHPKDFGDWRGTYRWMMDRDGQTKPYFVRGPYREEVGLKY